MPNATYHGPFTACDVPALRIEGAENGEPIEVTDEQAAVLATLPDWTVDGHESTGPSAENATEPATDNTSSDTPQSDDESQSDKSQEVAKNGA